jgi:hypothetical protein
MDPSNMEYSRNSEIFSGPDKILTASTCVFGNTRRIVKP